MSSIQVDKSKARLYSMLGQSGAAFGIGLINKARGDKKIITISADMVKPAGLLKFTTQFPDQFFNVGIAEQNLVGIAAGLSNEGYTVVASAQSCFLSMRSFEQVRQYSGYMNLPILFVGVASGFALTFFGNTHYALEDITLMRSIPGMIIISPSDSSQAAKAIECALDLKKPVYIRCTGIPGLKPLYLEDYDYSIGRAILLKRGKDITLFSSGSITINAKEAINIIEKKLNISIRLVDFHTIKPLDTIFLKNRIKDKLWITLEEHFIGGGLGAELSEYLVSQPHTTKPLLLKLGVRDKFSIPGDYEFLLKSNDLDSHGIAKNIINYIKKYL